MKEDPKIILHYPNTHEHPKQRTFAAYGKTLQNKCVQGVLTDSTPEKPKEIYGYTLRQPCEDPTGFWIVWFSPDDLKDYKNPFTLVISAVDYAGKETSLFTLPDIDLPDKPESPKEPKREDLFITTPLNTATVCSQFTVTGTAVDLSAVQASLTPSVGFSFVQKTPPPNWVLSCTAVPQDGAILTVSQPNATPPPPANASVTIHIIHCTSGGG